MAANSRTLADEDGDFSDWVELHNPGGEAIDLTGWYLTDDPTNHTRWRFPSVRLEAGGYLTVFASGKDRATATALHTDFRLASEGEYLALVEPDGVTVAHAYSYPEQLADVSYGTSHVLSTTILAGRESSASVLVPSATSDIAYGNSWTGGDEEAFADAGGTFGWIAGAAAIGFGAEFDDWAVTDLSDAMREVNTSVYSRIPFEVADPGAFSSLSLRIRYDDGFVAYLNGVRIASAAAPGGLGSLTWNSSAIANRSAADALAPVEFDITGFRSLLRAGTNVLAIHGLNAADDGSNFLLAPELVAATFDSDAGTGYFAVATPGARNPAAVRGFLAEPGLRVSSFAVGADGLPSFYTQPVTVEFTASAANPPVTTPPSAPIYYTLDGSEPTPEHAALYSGPLVIDRTTILRAAAFADGYYPSRVLTRTFLFSDVLAQPEIDSLNYGTYDALRRIPTLSLALDPADLFGATGIYTQFDRRTGAAGLPERPASIEYFAAGPCQDCPEDGFHINAGVRIDGSGERGWPKKSFRLRFRQEFGAARLEFPLLPDQSPSVDTLVLRAAAYDSWLSPYTDESSSATYLRDEFVRRTQAALGQPSPQGTFVQLYLNGQYWGLYNAVARPDEFYAAGEFGGEADDYDVLKNGKFPDAEVAAGDRDAWDAMLAIASAGVASDAAYASIQQYVDVDNLIDYLLTNFYTGTQHWLPDHWYAIRRRSSEGRFRFFSWDAESSLTTLDASFPSWSLGTSGTDVNAADSPGFLFQRLRENAQFRLRFADRIYAHVFGTGPLTPQVAVERWRQLMSEVAPGIAAEAARWGDERRPVSNSDRDLWAPQLQWMSNAYFPERSAVVLAQLRDLGLYPDVAPPLFNTSGGTIATTFELVMTAPRGDIYYTLDGSDPRLPVGSPSPTARLYTGPVPISGQARARAASLVDGQWSAAAEVYFSPAPTSLRITELMYRPAAASEEEKEAGFGDRDDFEFVELSNIGAAAVDLSGVRLTGGVRFDFSRGAIATLAPGESIVVVNNMAAFRHRYGVAPRIAGEYDGRLSNGGERLTLALVRPFATTIQSFEYLDDWHSQTDGGGSSLLAVAPAADPLAFSRAEGWRAGPVRHGTPGVFDPIRQDVTGDGRMSLADLAALQGRIGMSALAGSDLTGDGIIDRRDIAALLTIYGQTWTDPRDITPPVGPTRFSRPQVLAGPAVSLAWAPAFDPESGIAGYRVYRDGRPIGILNAPNVESSPPTTFVDPDVSAAFTYRYEVAAINSHGVEGPRSEPAFVRLPTIAAVVAESPTRLRVAFTDSVTSDTAQSQSNYRLGGAQVVAAQLEPDGAAVLLTTSALTPGHTYRLTVSGVVNDVGFEIAPDTETFFVSGPVSVDIAAPMVADVLIGSGEWTTSFLQRLVADGLGQGGVSLLHAPAAATTVLPWAGMDHLVVRFSEDVRVGIGDLAVTGINRGHYDIASFTYDPATFTAVWHLRQPLVAEHLSLVINSRVADLAGNYMQPLASALQAAVLVGDLDQDRDVDATDLVTQLTAGFSAASHAEYSLRHDLNGSGKVSIADAVILRDHRNNLLPARRVLITEFMAVNPGAPGLVDEDDDASDWIELHNADTTPINLAGWYLTDDVQNPTRWRFPEVVLQPGEYLVVFASGKDSSEPPGLSRRLHTNFSLDGDGEFLALVQPDGVTVASVYTGLGPQLPGVSFGRSSDTNRDRYFAAATPGAANPLENDVRITEFMAINHATLADEDGDYPDWIEIRNFGPTPEHLGGWTLENGGARWTIPPLTLDVGECRIVFASRNNRRDPEHELHANFALDGDGENLALVRPDGVAVTNFAAYPPQRPDVSFGLTPDGSAMRFFSQPTPCAPNPADDESVHFSVPRGHYDRPFNLSLSTDWLDAEIRYTLDGTLPTATHGVTYSPASPLWIDHSATIRAVAIVPGATPAPTTQTYIFLSDVLNQTGAGQPDTWGVHADYDVDPSALSSFTAEEVASDVFRSIPSVSLVLDADDLYSPVDGIYAYPHPMFEADWTRPGSLEFVPAATDTGTSFAATGRIEITGRESTRVSHLHAPQPKLSFRVAFDQGTPGLRLAAGSADPFPDSPATAFDSLVLRSAYEDSWLSVNGDQRSQASYVRDAWMRATQRAMGQPAVDGRFVHLYLNGLYWGLYTLTEDPGAQFAAQHLGGQPDQYDVIVGDAGGARVLAGDQDAAAWRTLSRLAAGDLANPAGYEALLNILDIESFIDYVLLDLYAYAGDPNGLMTAKDPNQGWFAVRSRSGGEKFRFFAWDNEVILGAGDENWLADSASSTPAPAISTASVPNAPFDPYTALENLRRNPEFAQTFSDRAHQHLSPGGALSPAAAADRFDNLANQIAAPLAGESGRWGDHRRDLDPNETGPYDEYEPEDADEENARLDEEFFCERGPFFLLSQLRDETLYPTIDAPTISVGFGSLAASPEPAAATLDPPTSPLVPKLELGNEVTLFSPAGILYYTLDGSDPRLAGGEISPSARDYSTPLQLNHSTIVTARARSGAQWSPIVRRTILLDQPPALRITELMYHPAPPPDGSPFTDDDFEFIELRNTGLEPLDVSGMRFTAGIDFSFDAAAVSTLAPGQRILLVRDTAAFTSRYPGAPGLPIAGQFAGQLNNGGDELVLVDRFGQIALRLAYDDAWQPITDGEGFSLVVDPGAPELPADLSTPRLAAQYLIPSQFHGGSPGADEPTLRPGDVVISEIFASADAQDPLGDWVELHNTTAAAIDLGGWFLSDAQDNPTRYRLPAGTTLPAGGYMLLTQREHFGFGLDRDGDEVYLASGDPLGRLGGYREAASFAATADGTSLGRHVTSQGAAEFVALQTMTPGAANSPPRVGPLIINEIHYAPVGPDGEPRPADEFVELRNTTDAPIALDGWKIDGGVEFEFPAGAAIAPFGFALVVAGDPTDFRNRQDVGSDVPVFGPFSGNLNNGGETLELFATLPSGNRTRIDYVRYDNEASWPMLAGGFGASLGRVGSSSFGNDVAYWSATLAPTPGAANLDSDSAPRGFPYVQDFSLPDGLGLESLAGWTFAVTYSNTTNVDSPGHPALWELPSAAPSGLVARQSVFGAVTHEATLRLDLSPYATADDLSLDFRLEVAGNFTTDRAAKLLVSGDGRLWTEAANLLGPIAGQELHYAIDLDRVLARAGIAGDSDVYLRFYHTGQSPADTLRISDFRASTLDFFGPQIISHITSGAAGGLFSTFDVTFDEPVNPTTFAADDVSLVGPTGGTIIPTRLETLDGRTWRLTFDPQQLRGDYRFSIGPNVTDLAGNAMTHSGVIVSGLTAAGVYSGVFSIGPIVAHPLPYAADLATCNLVDFVDWGFAATPPGTLNVVDGDDIAGCQLTARQNAAGAVAQDAVVRLDLSTVPTGGDLELDFYLTRFGGDAGNLAALYLSGDGSNWRRVYGLNPPLGERTHFSFDLDALLIQHELPRSDLYLRFSHVGAANGDEMRLDHVRVGRLGSLGPRVVAATALPAAGPIEVIELAFDQPLDPASFSLDDITFITPSGEAAVPLSLFPRAETGNRVWNLSLPIQTLAGAYRLLVSPSLADAAGHPMNQDGDPIGGEMDDDPFGATFTVAPTPSIAFPYIETFHAADLNDLTAWSLAPDALGHGSILCSGAPDCGDGQFSVVQHGDGPSRQGATLSLDATAWPAGGGVFLDFWAELAGSYTAAHRASLLVSGDGRNWSFASPLMLVPGRAAHFAFDLRDLLSQSGVQLDQDVFIQWAHFGAADGDAFHLDAVRVTGVPSFGPRIESYVPVEQNGGVSRLVLSFDSPIDPASFAPGDVTIYLGDPAIGADIDFTATAIEPLDERHFAVDFPTPTLGGLYHLVLRPSLRDLAGVPLNQNGDALAGDPLADRFAMTFRVEAPAQAFPYYQGFESGTFSSLAGWTFEVMGEFDAGQEAWEHSAVAPHSGQQSLLATQSWDCWTDHDAVLTLDLGQVAEATDLVLEFWLRFDQRENQSLTDRRSARLRLRGEADGSWIDVTGDIVQVEGEFVHYQFDLDQLLRDHSIAPDSDVYFDFNRRGFHKRSGVTLDDIGVYQLGARATGSASAAAHSAAVAVRPRPIHDPSLAATRKQVVWVESARPTTARITSSAPIALAARRSQPASRAAHAALFASLD